MAHDSSYSEQIEYDCLGFANCFAFAIAAQYIRTFEDTEVAQEVRRHLDHVFVQTMIAMGELPLFLDEDLEFGSMHNDRL